MYVTALGSLGQGVYETTEKRENIDLLMLKMFGLFMMAVVGKVVT
jgi:hypothetical protein